MSKQQRYECRRTNLCARLVPFMGIQAANTVRVDFYFLVHQINICRYFHHWWFLCGFLCFLLISFHDNFPIEIACRYDKGEWSKCVNGSMSRKDNVRAGSDATCKPNREINKNCTKDKKQKKQDKSKYSHAICS